jgi:DNA-directed RNA polymerase subunit beta'
VRISEHSNWMPTTSGSPRSPATRPRVGRALLSEILPRGLPFKVIDKPLKKKEISKLINESFRRCGLKETVIFADQLMQAGLPPGDPCRHFDRRR